MSKRYKTIIPCLMIQMPTEDKVKWKISLKVYIQKQTQECWLKRRNKSSRNENSIRRQELMLHGSKIQISGVNHLKASRNWEWQDTIKRRRSTTLARLRSRLIIHHRWSNHIRNLSPMKMRITSMMKITTKKMRFLVKLKLKSNRQPNQTYHIQKMSCTTLAS